MTDPDLEEAVYDSSGVFTLDPGRALTAARFQPHDAFLLLGQIAYDRRWTRCQPEMLSRGVGMRFYQAAFEPELVQEIRAASEGRRSARSQTALDVLGLVQALQHSDTCWALRLTCPDGSEFERVSPTYNPYQGWIGPKPGGFAFLWTWGERFLWHEVQHRWAYHPVRLKSASLVHPATPFRRPPINDYSLVARSYLMADNWDQAFPVRFPAEDLRVQWNGQPLPTARRKGGASWLAQFWGDLPPLHQPSHFAITRQRGPGLFGFLHRQNHGPAHWSLARGDFAPARLLVGIRRDLQGDGQLYLVRRGVALNPLDLQLGVPGLFVVLADSAVGTDASGLKPVMKEPLQAWLPLIRQHADRLLTALHEVFQGDDYARKFIGSKLPQSTPQG